MKNIMQLVGGVLLLSSLTSGQTQDKVLNALLERIKEQEARVKTAVTDMTVSQTMTTFGADGAAGIEADAVMYAKGDKVRLEIGAKVGANDTSAEAQAASDMMQAMGQTVMIYDGEAVHMQMPMMGWHAFPPESKEAQQAQGQRSWSVWITGDITLIGSEEIDGVPCAVLVLDNNEYAPYDKLWVDRERLVPLKAEAYDPNAAPVTTRYYGYRREADGLYVPYRAEILNNEQLVTRMTVADVKINTGLDDALFIPGKGGSALSGLMGMSAGMGETEADSSDEKPRSSGCCLLGGDGGEGFSGMLDMFMDMLFGGF